MHRQARRRRILRRGGTTAVAVALALLLAGCPATRRAPEGNPDRAIEAGDTYVALGDSYTAGYLTGALDPDSGGCLRSLDNYPHRLARELDLRLTDVSCGGATTEDVTAPQQPSRGGAVPPQLEAVDEDTALVTIGLGGNDFNLFGVLIVSCVQAGRQDPAGAPCADLAAENPKAQDNIGKIRDRLVDVVDAVRDRAPEARIVLVGYPQTFPASTGCAQLPLAEGDIPFAYDALISLNSAVSSAARKTGAEYVDVWAASEGHDICAAEPWIAGAAPPRPDGAAYHPYPEEQELVAGLLLEVLEGEAGRD
ncbi:SGNH/GDSL hydrolase family protein [Nocardioides sp. LHD-245]|uniref:SGNH/GDSL hydrolase family protein n=1 Tax=Nocardioides sp. LHD-245 TaxID=3051387 RepID=UPI0027E0BA99|nr:SGNH/GDSL hydrolase family protein [Nocardioides sp. LHD-245]